MNYNDNTDDMHKNNKIKHIFNISNYIKYISDNIKNNNFDKKLYKMENEINKLNKNEINEFNAFEKVYLDDDNINKTSNINLSKGLDLKDAHTNTKIYFPLISNENQNEILYKINDNNNVIVFGANGTGKTHSIVNLASHYMAKGNKVLITYPDSNINYSNRFSNEFRNLIYDSNQEIHNIDNIRNSMLYINDILKNKDIVNVARRIELFENEIKNHKSGIILLRNEMKHYELQQGYEIIDTKGTAHLPMYIYNTHKKDPILRDYIKFNINTTIKNNRKCVNIVPDFSIGEDKILILRDQREKVVKNLRDYIYECKLLPYMASGKEYEQICKDLKEVDKLNESILKENTGVKLIKDSCEYVDYVEKLKTIVTVELYIKSDWQKKILRELKDIDSSKSGRYFSLYTKLEQMMQDVKKANDKLDSKYIISLNPNWNIEELYRKIDDFVEIKSSNNVLKKVFDNKLHKFETEIKVNGKNAKNATPDELEQIKYTVKYYYEVYKFISNMEEIANTLDLPIKYEQNYTHITLDKLLEKYNQFAQIFEYVKLEEELKNMSDRLIEIVDNKKLEENGLPCTYYKLYLIVALHYKKEKYKDSIKVYRKMQENFDNLEKDNPNYQTIKDIKKCLENYRDNIFMARWYQIYSHLSEVEKYRDVFDDFKNSIDEIYAHLPRYAEDLLDIQIPTLKILPLNLNESIQINVELEYVQELSDMENKLKDLGNKINLEEQAITSLKHDLINLNIQYALLKNISAYEKRLIEDYINLDGKQEKVFLSNENNIQELKSIIPIWIMPISKVVELENTDKVFDLILIDEANKFNILDISMLTLAKKSIVFGDLKQLSYNDLKEFKTSKKEDNENVKLINKAKETYLLSEKDLINDNNYNIHSNLLELLSNLVNKDCQITLAEQYINMPKIIGICNKISYYDDKLIGINVSDVNNFRYPLLKEVYLEDSKYENDINKDEAIKIINILKECLDNPVYENKTFGIISMLSEKQEAYIEDIIKDYITIDKMKEIKLKVGMPKDFENDAKDVIIASMGINELNINKDILIADTERKFNAKLIISTITKAKEQLILVHSIDKEKIEDKQNPLYVLIDNVSKYELKPLYNQNLEEQCDSQFTIEIYKYLLRKGYKVIPQYKIDTYTITLLVLKNNRKFAIKCYGAKYYSEEEWEENRFREQQLEAMGWNFYRILGTSFYKDKPLLLDELDKSLIEYKMY